MFQRILSLSMGIFICACSHQQVKEEIASFSKEAICLPAELEVVQGGVIPSDSLNRILVYPIKLIFYFSPERCTSCTVDRLGDYESIFNLTVEDAFSPIIIFSSKNALEYKVLITELQIRSLPYPVYIDKQNIFQQLNSQLPKDTRYHSFLLDKNNRVVLVGNPLASDAMWSLFRSTLDNMLAHDGVYVPEK